ncbi:MAG: MBL fold metallo-hydrolase [Nitrospirota bacterium]
MKKTLQIGRLKLCWLRGGSFELDGGTAFGPVPKTLWSKKISADQDNYVPIRAWPILVKTPTELIILESGLGNKLSGKQRKIFRIREEWYILQDLADLGIRREEIDYVILSHYDWDHSAGVVMHEAGRLELTFPKARHIIQKTEWEDVLHPNKRSSHTYWQINIETLQKSGNLELVQGESEIVRGIKAVLTGGHTRGHQIVTLESEAEKGVYLGDLLPTHMHYNPLWVTAYDNFPLDSIAMKELYLDRFVREAAWFILYQDPIYQACKFDLEGTITNFF